MATAKKTSAAKEVKGIAQGTRRVPYTLPLTRENAENDRFVFVSVNDYTATIERGKEVMIPENVAQMLEQREREEMEAFLSAIGKENEFLGTV